MKVMEFQDSRPIFMQIVDRMVDRILAGELKPDDPVPSVREQAAEMGVNPNTVMRAFERLSMSEMIYNQRGRGYFVTAMAREKALEERRDNFFKNTLPRVMAEMRLLGISTEDLINNITTK